VPIAKAHSSAPDGQVVNCLCMRAALSTSSFFFFVKVALALLIHAIDGLKRLVEAIWG